MAAPGEGHHLDIFSVVDQLIDQCQRIGIVNVVVTRTMRDQQFSLKLACIFDW